MAQRKQQQPSGLAIWLGVAGQHLHPAEDRQVRRRLGGQLRPPVVEFVTVVALVFAWWLATVGGFIDPIFWPPLEGSLYPWDDPNRAKPGVVDRFVGLVVEGYRNVSLWEHVWTSVKRVLLGVFLRRPWWASRSASRWA